MACRGSSHTLMVNCPQQEEAYLASPTGRCFLLYYLSKWKKYFSPSWATTQPVRDCHNSANETFELPISFSGLTVTARPISPFSSIKEQFLSFILQICLWFCHSSHIPICNSLLFLNKPISAGKITDFFFRSTLEMQILYCPWPTEPESLGIGPRSLHFNESSRLLLPENSCYSFSDTGLSQTQTLLTPLLLTPWSEHPPVLPGTSELLTNWNWFPWLYSWALLVVFTPQLWGGGSFKTINHVTLLPCLKPSNGFSLHYSLWPL